MGHGSVVVVRAVVFPTQSRDETARLDGARKCGGGELREMQVPFGRLRAGFRLVRRGELAQDDGIVCGARQKQMQKREQKRCRIGRLPEFRFPRHLMAFCGIG